MLHVILMRRLPEWSRDLGWIEAGMEEAEIVVFAHVSRLDDPLKLLKLPKKAMTVCSRRLLRERLI